MKWNFVHVPKTGGTSIAEAIGFDERLHARASETPEPRFAFVRHPLDRLVSAWEFMRNGRWEKLRNHTQRMSFRDFITDENVFLYPQVYWLDAPMAFVGRFERLVDDFRIICDQPLKHLQASQRRPWAEYFDSETKAIAVARYAEDFQRFGYVA